jgi:hypothetical protein
MKTKITKTNFLKCASFAIIMFGVTAANAQQTTGDVLKATNIVPGTTTTGGSVRVVDNKGTVKYLQSKNGITMLSNTTLDVTTTTWQLGGTLTNDTYIDATGAAFALDGIEFATATTSSTNATDKSVHTTATGTGWTLLVRDEATGATKKLLAKDLLQAGQEVFTVAAIPLLTYPLTGAPVLPTVEKVSVYRNGAKLLAGVDYTVAASTVTLVPSAIAPNDWAVYAGDKIEVHFVK